MKIQNNMAATRTTVGSVVKGTCFIDGDAVYIRGDNGIGVDLGRIRCTFLGCMSSTSTFIAGDIAWFPTEHLVTPIKSVTLVIE